MANDVHRAYSVRNTVRLTVWLQVRVLGFLVLNFVWISGCFQPNRDAPTSPGAALTRTDDVLEQCVGAYDRLSTLQVQGVLSDFRHGGRRVVPVSWDFARPARCRLQIDRDVAIIHGADSWTYRAATGRFLGSRSASASPIQSAASVLSDGVPFLLPALWEDGKAALGRDPIRGFAGWKLQGVAWSGDRPCYVFVRRSTSSGRGNLLRLWIDQDLLLIRSWSMVDASEDGREKTIVECAHHHIVTNGRLPPNRFQLQPPEPMELPTPLETTGGHVNQNPSDPS